jgi:capsular polysaccharide biosynthesis protein
VNSALTRLEKRYEELNKQHMDARVTVASNPEWTVTIISPASPAYQKKTRDYVRIALGPLFSLIVSLGFAFFVDNLDHSIKNVAEAEEALGFQVLASFPDTEK